MRIDPSSHQPIYQQIIEGVRASVAAGVYRPGESLPSIRAMALEVKVNPNTVQRAYEELEREGLIYQRRGVGMFVAERGAREAKDQAEARVRELFEAGADAAKAADLSQRRVRQLAMKAIGAAAQIKRLAENRKR